jgi:hypothetical protein
MSKTPNSENQGEGNRDAARRYNSATEDYAHSGKVKPAAEDAKDALAGPEKDALEKAEKEGRAHAKS